MAWTAKWIGKNNSDSMLDPGEKAVITVWLHPYDSNDIVTGSLDPADDRSGWSSNDTTELGGDATSFFIGTDRVDTYHKFTLEVKPVSGATLTIQRTTPAVLDSIVDMH